MKKGNKEKKRKEKCLVSFIYDFIVIIIIIMIISSFF